MRIAVNTRFLLKDKMEGFGWFTFETMKRITTQHPEHEFIFLFDRPYHEDYVFSDNVTPVVIGPQARHPILFRIWFNRSVKRALKKFNADLFVSPDGYLSLTTDLPQLAVIHDLNFEHYPKDLPASARRYLLKYFPKFAHKAQRIVTVSEYSKQDIIEQYGINEELIDVVYNGVSELYEPTPTESQKSVREKYTEGNEYFVYVGSLHPRKNLGRLMQAFDRYRDNGGNCDLLIVGERYWWSDEMEAVHKGMKHQRGVRFTGHLEQTELCRVIGSARAMTYVSYFEGFGIPAVEAMVCGVPLITSNTTSLPEVAGDAAILVDPYSVDEITNAMMRIDSDDVLAKELVRKGLVRGEQFDWQHTADGLWSSIEKCMSNA